MKTKFALLLLLTTSIYSQIKNTDYGLADNNELVQSDSLKTKTSDTKALLKEDGLFTDYYKNGKKKSVANYVDGKLDGDYSTWYENGNQKSTSFYIRGGVNGKVTEWYENGNKKSDVEYYFVTTKVGTTKTTKTTEVKINQFWDENGVQNVIDGNGEYEEKAKGYYATGNVRNGYKEGVWTGKYLDLNYSFSETYKANKIIGGVGVDKDNVSHKYTEIRAKAMPKDGMIDFNSYMAKSLKEYKGEGFNGKIFVQVDVEVDGNVVDVKIVRDPGNGIGEAVIKAIKSYKGWSPAELRGRKVRGFFTGLIGG